MSYKVNEKRQKSSEHNSDVMYDLFMSQFCGISLSQGVRLLGMIPL